jgi:cytochrome P450
MTALGPFDVTGVDFACDDHPDPHATLARLRARRPFAIVPFAGTSAVLLLSDELVRAAFREEATFPAAPVYAMTTEPVFGKTVLSMSGAQHRASRTLVSAPLRRGRPARRPGGIALPSTTMRREHACSTPPRVVTSDAVSDAPQSTTSRRRLPCTARRSTATSAPETTCWPS